MKAQINNVAGPVPSASRPTPQSRAGNPALVDLQTTANQSPKVQSLMQLVSTQAGGNPPAAGSAGDGGETIQRISAEDARTRLGASAGSDVTVAVLILMDTIRTAVPAIEAALAGYSGFIAGLPTRVFGGLSDPLSQRVGRYCLKTPVKDLTEQLGSFSDVLEGIEDWYVDTDLATRDEKAVEQLETWTRTAAAFEGAAGHITELFAANLDSSAGVLAHGGYRAISTLRGEIGMWFGVGSGFSAVARAHEIDVDIAQIDPEKKPEGFPESEHYLGGYYQGGEDPTSFVEERTVTKPEGRAVEAGPVTILGVGEGGQPDDDPARRAALQAAVEGPITALGGNWDDRFTAAPAPMSRGKGQYAAMNRTNARGYAWLYDVAGWGTTAWEWLHVRGASLGGVTTGANLVLGTRDANTLMMPFEANIRYLAGLVKTHDALDRLDVQWHALDGGNHLFRTLIIKWTVVPSDTADHATIAAVDAANGQLVVATLAGRTNLSKVEVRALEQALSDQRHRLQDQEGV